MFAPRWVTQPKPYRKRCKSYSNSQTWIQKHFTDLARLELRKPSQNWTKLILVLSRLKSGKFQTFQTGPFILIKTRKGTRVFSTGSVCSWLCSAQLANGHPPPPPPPVRPQSNMWIMNDLYIGDNCNEARMFNLNWEWHRPTSYWLEHTNAQVNKLPSPSTLDHMVCSRVGVLPDTVIHYL